MENQQLEQPRALKIQAPSAACALYASATARSYAKSASQPSEEEKHSTRNQLNMELAPQEPSKTSA